MSSGINDLVGVAVIALAIVCMAWDMRDRNV
jgi:hypothetical protein